MSLANQLVVGDQIGSDDVSVSQLFGTVGDGCVFDDGRSVQPFLMKANGRDAMKLFAFKNRH